MFVTNGNSRLQEQGEIEKSATGDPLGPKRGIGAVHEAVPTVDWGENSTTTVAGVVVGVGECCCRCSRCNDADRHAEGFLNASIGVVDLVDQGRGSSVEEDWDQVAIGATWPPPRQTGLDCSAGGERSAATLWLWLISTAIPMGCYHRTDRSWNISWSVKSYAGADARHCELN